MHICSYLVHVSRKEGSLASVTQALNALPGCEATPDNNENNVLILVTETDDREADTHLLKKIETITDVECIALVFGATDPTGVPVS